MLNLLNKILHIFLPERKIWGIKNNHNIPSMEWSLLNIKNLGFDPQIAIDAGAFDGQWTIMFKKIYPNCNILMVEAQVEKEAELQKVAAAYKDVNLHIGLLGAENGRK